MENSAFYFDPNHGGCLRIITKLEKDKYLIEGAYGSDEGGKGQWVAEMTKTKKFKYKGEDYNLIVDFGKKQIKTHKNIYYAYMGKRTIKWQDGNKWIQMYV
uniref:Uncharacterized protein n=1 Tax=viral metagenome TaxID=1070528 RepID=A0A6C0LJ26_9ZZZZ|tara:strand:+ start:2756 stop:3058 length:303 start_codon:yes stop_codon:yes gene_type:complete